MKRTALVAPNGQRLADKEPPFLVDPSQLDPSQRHYLQPPKGFFKAEVYVTRLSTGEAVVCKDYSRFNKWWNAPLASWLAKRERKILERLKDWPHSPNIFPCSSPLLLIEEYIPGRALAEKPVVTSAIYCSLFVALMQLHQMGIAHNDIRSANIILNEENVPILVDFTSACTLPLVFGLVLIMRWLRLFDLRHLVKIKRSLKLPLHERENRLLQRAAWQQRLLDLWKKHLLPLLKQRKSKTRL
jgi:hypothetical protein